jgi:hypothetical protein
MIKPVDKSLKNSVYKAKSRYVMGGKTEVSPDKVEWWNKDFISADSTDVIYVLEKKFEGRPDLLAQAFYDEPYLWWVICQFNAILDFNTEFVEGVILRIPTKNRVISLISANKMGGIPSEAK